MGSLFPSMCTSIHQSIVHALPKMGDKSRAFVSIALIAGEVLAQRQSLNQIKREIYLRHHQHLSSGDSVSLNASSIHLEMINAMSRILSHTCSIARVIQGEL
ncbi:hypothetical protein [Nostoc sp.]|uniref:hypothetical protein n=1 Tax=Nostoc sp. TaxID=1180 RepID=UPI002FFD2C2E